MFKSITCAVTAIVLSGAVAHAEDRVVTKAVVIHFDDLDLSHDAGAKVMINRITNAAREACGPAPDMRELEERADYNSCVTTARDKAIDALHAPLVAALAGRGAASFTVANR